MEGFDADIRAVNPYYPRMPFNSLAVSRRDFLKRAAALGPAMALAGRSSAVPASAWPPPVGYATISWPEAEFDQALETIASLGFAGVQMLGWVRDANLGAKAAALKQRLEALKLFPAALSCSRLKLDPARADDATAEFRAYAAFLQNLDGQNPGGQGLGGRVLQVMDGGRPELSYSADQVASLGARMTALGRVAREYGLTLGYHPHFGTFGETREGLGRVLAAADPGAVKLIADVAHLQLGGSDPAEVIRTYRDRVVLVHFKDLRRDAAEAARQGRDEARRMKYHFAELGRGVVDFPGVIRALREAPGPYWIIVELDAYEPPAGGAGESARLNREALGRMGLMSPASPVSRMSRISKTSAVG